jgi:uncharacterized protein
MHPKIGASWEGFIIEQCIACIGDRDVYFWATHAGAELDFLFTRDGRRIGVEVKYSAAPSTTKSMHTALEDLALDRLYVVYPGRERYRLHQKIEALPATMLDQL